MPSQNCRWQFWVWGTDSCTQTPPPPICPASLLPPLATATPNIQNVTETTPSVALPRALSAHAPRRAGRKLLCGGGGGVTRKPIFPTPPPPSLAAVTGGGGSGRGCPTCCAGGGGGEVNPTSMAQNDTHVALSILTTQIWGRKLLVEKTFAGQILCSCAFGANIRSYTKQRARHGTPFLQPPPPLLRRASMSPPPPALQSNFQVAKTQAVTIASSMHQSSGDSPISTSSGQERVKVNGRAATNIPKVPLSTIPSLKSREKLALHGPPEKGTTKFHSSQSCRRNLGRSRSSTLCIQGSA